MRHTPFLFSLAVATFLGFLFGCKQQESVVVAESSLLVRETAKEAILTSGNSSSSSGSLGSSPSGAFENDEPEPTINGRLESQACNPVKDANVYGKSDCADGLVCVPHSANTSKGSCRVKCGETVKNKDVKSPELCSEQRSCQSVTTLSLDPVGIFCMPIQTVRDGECSALSDENACSDNRICAVSEVNKDENGLPYASSFLCRESCPFGKADADSSCPHGEKCVAYPYESTSQTDEGGKPVMCTESKCTQDSKDCECDLDNGYKCSPLIPNVIAFCDRSAGICTNPVRFASVLDFESGKFKGDKCNEVKGHDYCDNGLFAGLERPGESLCIQMSEKTGDGFCFAFCSSPSLDLNQDGQLMGKEVGQNLMCPEAFSCNTHLGRQLGFVSAIPDKNATNGRKTCNPKNCQEGAPCPNECGLGDAECLSYLGQDGQVMSFCGAPFGNCEPSMSLL